jgi:hypothetical protein
MVFSVGSTVADAAAVFNLAAMTVWSLGLYLYPDTTTTKTLDTEWLP